MGILATINQKSLQIVKLIGSEKITIERITRVLIGSGVTFSDTSCLLRIRDASNSIEVVDAVQDKCLIAERYGVVFLGILN